MPSLGLRIFDCPVRIESHDPVVSQLVAACYSAFFDAGAPEEPAAMRCVVETEAEGRAWQVRLQGVATRCDGLADLAYTLEKALTIELQTLRRDLFFVHGAAIDAGNRCTVITGESGAGKSTLCWGLVNEGLSYMSDELAPVDLETLEVEPYPHAVCLKRIVEGGHAAPAEAFRTAVTLHIPVERLPGGIRREPARIANVVFLTRAERGVSGLEEISRSEAAARLYANSLNQLAHEKDGLKAASKLTGGARCFCLARTDLPEMRRELLRLIRGA